MRPILCALIVTLALAGCDARSEPEKQQAAPLAEATMAEPYIRLPAVAGRPVAGYFRLRVEGDRGALVSVTSPQAKRIEMHETMASGSMSSMRPIARLPLKDGDEIAFQPGGRHLMLYELDPTLMPGTKAQIVLHFTSGDPVTLAADVVPAGGDHGGH